MKLTIIPTSNLVMLNDVNYLNIDMSWIPLIDGVEIHAVEWDEDHGWIHLVTTDPHIPITELGIFEKAVELWEEKRQEHIKYEEDMLARQKEEEALIARIREEEELKRLEEERLAKIEFEPDDGDEEVDEDEDLFYDIEQLLKEL
jgi:ribosomal protein L14E/L6E/L27E